MNSVTDKIASTHLGKKSQSADYYNPRLLVAVPRYENRKIYGIGEKTLPFAGFDVWHAYEFSFLTENGLPVNRVIKIIYDCKSEFIVESKSLKLYLNSFNLTKFGKDKKEGLKICKTKIENDLSKILNTKVKISFLEENTKYAKIFSGYKDITEFTDEKKLKITDFRENPKLLQTNNTTKSSVHRLKFSSLRSNCRITHQPDFGNAYLYYKSKKHIDEESLIQYLTSFRKENHFHEECCEMIFKRISDILNPNDELMVCTMYTRRGGIDINPIRWKNCKLKDFDKLSDLNLLARNGIKQ